MEDQIMNELWIKHESLRGRADVLSHATGAELDRTYYELPLKESDLRELIAYYEGFCDAAITVLELKVREKESWTL